MNYVKVHDVEFKECEHTNWDKINVLEVIFIYWEQKLRVLIQDAEKEHIDKLVGHAKKEAKKYFKNKESILLENND